MKSWWVDYLSTRRAAEGGWAPLARAIDAANPGAPKAGRHLIDRTTLQRLCEGRDPKLSLSQLAAIDAYLTRHGFPGLSDRPFFARTVSPLSMFAHNSRIAIIVGARYLKEFGTEVISRHDVDALRQIDRHPIGRDCFTEIRNILKRDPQHPDIQLTMAEFSDLIAGVNTQNIIAIGSPLGNRGTEILLAEMTGATPFEKSLRRPLPVRFLFPSAADRESAFFVNERDARAMRPRPDLQGFDARVHRAVIVNGRVFLSRDEQQKGGDVYSVLLMARSRDNAGIHACLMGTSGPATAGLANVVSDGDALDCPELPLRRSSSAAPAVLVAVIRTRISVRTDFLSGEARQDPRHVGDSEVAMAPTLLERSRNRWVATDG